MSDEEKSVWVPCAACGGQTRNHVVLQEHTQSATTLEDDISEWNTYQIIMCRGCEQIKFRSVSACSEHRAWDTGEYEEYNSRVLPETASQKHGAVDASAFPADVRKMYLETVVCFNAGANTLAGAGLRATVEAICRERNATGNNLQQRITSLVSQGVLAQAQADHLDEERYIGNDALHEMRTPADQDILDGLEIVETLLKTVYVLPAHADRLRQSRQASLTSQTPASNPPVAP